MVRRCQDYDSPPVWNKFRTVGVSLSLGGGGREFAAHSLCVYTWRASERERDPFLLEFLALGHSRNAQARPPIHFLGRVCKLWRVAGFLIKGHAHHTAGIGFLDSGERVIGPLAVNCWKFPNGINWRSREIFILHGDEEWQRSGFLCVNFNQLRWNFLKESLTPAILHIFSKPILHVCSKHVWALSKSDFSLPYFFRLFCLLERGECVWRDVRRWRWE